MPRTVEEIEALRDKADAAGKTDVVRELDRILASRRAAPEDRNRELGLGEAAWQGLINIPRSGFKAVGDIVEGVSQAVQHPIETGQALGTAAQGGLQYAGAGLRELRPEWMKPYVDSKYTLDAPTPEMQAVAPIGQEYKERYGSWKNIKRTLAEDPVRLLSDTAGTVFPVAGAASKLPVVGKTLGTLSKVAEAAQPSNLATVPVRKIIDKTIGETPFSRMRRGAPSEQSVRADKNAKYQELRDRGIQFTAGTYGNMINNLGKLAGEYTQEAAPITRGIIRDVTREFKRRGALMQIPVVNAQKKLEAAEARLKRAYASTPSKVPQYISERDAAEAALEVATREAAVGPTADFNTIENIRKQAIDVPLGGSQRSATDVGQAGRILRETEQAWNTLQDDVPDVREARELGQRDIVHRQLSEAESRGGMTVAGFESGGRGQAARFLKRNEAKLTPTQEASVRKILSREGWQNIAHMMGGRLGLLAAMAGTMGGAYLPAALVVPAAVGASIASRGLLERMTRIGYAKAKKTALAGKEAQEIAEKQAARIRRVTKATQRGASASLTGAGAYGAMTRPVEVTSPEQEEFWYGKRK